MAICSKGNNEKIAMLMIATRSKGNIGQVAGMHGKCNIGRVDKVCGECNDGKIMYGRGDKGQIAALAMATIAGAHWECEDRQIAGKCNDGQITSAHGKGYVEGSSPGAEGCSAPWV